MDEIQIKEIQGVAAEFVIALPDLTTGIISAKGRPFPFGILKIKKNFKIIDSHLIPEKNIRMRAECEQLDGKGIKRFRIYQKPL